MLEPELDFLMSGPELDLVGVPEPELELRMLEAAEEAEHRMPEPEPELGSQEPGLELGMPGAKLEGAKLEVGQLSEAESELRMPVAELGMPGWGPGLGMSGPMQVGPVGFQ